jgi:hypothetical protein
MDKIVNSLKKLWSESIVYKITISIVLLIIILCKILLDYPNSPNFDSFEYVIIIIMLFCFISAIYSYFQIKKEANALGYYTIDKLSEYSGMTEGQIIGNGISGNIVFSIRGYEPSNYEEEKEFVDDKGTLIKKTIHKERKYLVGKEDRDFKYITSEDFEYVIENEKKNRATLINKLFFTRDLVPNQGKSLFNNQLKIRQKISETVSSAALRPRSRLSGRG